MRLPYERRIRVVVDLSLWVLWPAVAFLSVGAIVAVLFEKFW